MTYPLKGFAFGTRLPRTIPDLLRHHFNTLREDSYWVTSRSNV